MHNLFLFLETGEHLGEGQSAIGPAAGRTFIVCVGGQCVAAGVVEGRGNTPRRARSCFGSLVRECCKISRLCGYVECEKGVEAAVDIREFVCSK